MFGTQRIAAAVAAAVGMVLLVAGAPRSVEAAPEVAAGAEMGLEACLEEGLDRSPMIAAARENLGVFEAKLTQVKWGWFPYTKLQASVGPTPSKRGDALSGETDFSEWGVAWKVKLEGAFPLYTFGKLSALKEAAYAGVDVAEAAMDMARAEVRFRVKQAYTAWQLGREIEDLVADGVKHLDRARKRLEKMEEEDDDDFDQVDLLRLRVYQADVETILVESQRMQAVALHGMALVLGREQAHGAPPMTLKPVDLERVDAKPGELEKRLVAAAEEQPMLRALRHGVRAQKALADVKYAELFPDFYLGGYINYAQSDVIDDQGSPFAYDPWNTWSGGAAVGLRYSLDIPGKLARWEEARAQAGLTDEMARVQAAQAALEVESAWREAADLYDLLRTYARAERAARSWLVAKSDLYDSGFAELKDVTDALVEYFKRRIGHRKAIHDYNMAVARLEKAVGAEPEFPPVEDGADEQAE